MYQPRFNLDYQKLEAGPFQIQNQVPDKTEARY